MVFNGQLVFLRDKQEVAIYLGVDAKKYYVGRIGSTDKIHISEQEYMEMTHLYKDGVIYYGPHKKRSFTGSLESSYIERHSKSMLEAIESAQVMFLNNTLTVKSEDPEIVADYNKPKVESGNNTIIEEDEEEQKEDKKELHNFNGGDEPELKDKPIPEGGYKTYFYSYYIIKDNYSYHYWYTTLRFDRSANKNLYVDVFFCRDNNKEFERIRERPTQYELRMKTYDEVWD